MSINFGVKLISRRRRLFGTPEVVFGKKISRLQHIGGGLLQRLHAIWAFEK